MYLKIVKIHFHVVRPLVLSGPILGKSYRFGQLMRLHHDTMRLLKIDFVFFPLRRTKKSISSWIINRAVWVLKSFLKPFPIWRWLSLHHFLKNFWDARKYTYRSVVFSQSNICFLKIGIISVNFNSLRKSLCIVTCLFHISALCLQLMLEISFFFRILVGKVLYESTFLLSRLLISLKIPSNVTSENWKHFNALLEQCCNLFWKISLYNGNPVVNK